MKKRRIHVFNKDMYLLGKNQEGLKVWLEAPSWDCDWYWGFGYLEVLTSETNPEGSKDIISHTHWDSSVKNSGKNAHEWFEETFVETPLSDDEIWTLCELMDTFYCLKEFAELCHMGGMNYTTNPLKHKLQNDELNKYINNDLLLDVFEEIKVILIEGYKRGDDFDND